MRDFASKRIKSIKPSGIRKFFDIARTIEGCISLGVGEPDFPTPWHITEEGIYALEHGKTHYTSNQGMPELRKEISAWNKRKYGLDYPADDIIVTCGGSEAIDIALRACIDPGDEVIILEPSYVCYEPDVVLAGGAVKTIKLQNSNKFKLTPEELEAAIGPKTKIVVINYPNNPTGAIMGEDDLRKISEVIIKHDLLVISDEIYSELTYKGTHCSIGSLPNMRERTITVNGFSKAFSMTEMLEVLRRYDFSHQRRLSFEYTMFDGVNDSMDDARQLVKTLSGLSCRVNLIRFHTIPDSPLRPVSEEKMIEFRDWLTGHGVFATIRASRGEDIWAACGMLSTAKNEQS